MPPRSTRESGFQRLLLAQPEPARLHLGIPLIEAMQTRYARREFFSS